MKHLSWSREKAQAAPEAQTCKNALLHRMLWASCKGKSKNTIRSIENIYWYLPGPADMVSKDPCCSEFPKKQLENFNEDSGEFYSRRDDFRGY
jgi:hypothetical protein